MTDYKAHWQREQTFAAIRKASEAAKSARVRMIIQEINDNEACLCKERWASECYFCMTNEALDELKHFEEE